MFPHSTTRPQSLPFEKVQHKVLTTDAQPMENNNLIIVVTGLLVVRVTHPLSDHLPIV
jgi:hypothetical protein